jgi:hypothetical protein
MPLRKITSARSEKDISNTDISLDVLKRSNDNKSNYFLISIFAIIIMSIMNISFETY